MRGKLRERGEALFAYLAALGSAAWLLPFQPLMDTNRWAQATAREPSPTAKPTRLTDPARMSPAARTPGTLVSSGHGSRSDRGHNPEAVTSAPVSTKPLASRAIPAGSHAAAGSAPMNTNTAAQGSCVAARVTLFRR